MTEPESRLRGKVLQALRGLVPEHREIIVLTQIDKLSLRQIAERSGISVETLQLRATEALLSLRRALDEAEPAR